MPKPGSEYEAGFSRLFSHDEVYFTDPLRFNDPFDCTCLFCLKGSTEDDWRKFWAMKYPGETAEAVDRRVRETLTPGGCIDWESSGFDRKRLDVVMRMGLQEMRILCLSERWDSMLMWAHYGDSHRGLCLQFDHERVADKWACKAVAYRRHYPSFAEFLKTAPGGAATADFLLLNKATPWRYEHEWRILAYTGVSQTAPAVLPPRTLRGVLFGCMTSEEDKERVARWIGESGNRDVMLYDLERHPEEYRLMRTKREPQRG